MGAGNAVRSSTRAWAREERERHGVPGPVMDWMWEAGLGRKGGVGVTPGSGTDTCEGGGPLWEELGWG